MLLGSGRQRRAGLENVLMSDKIRRNFDLETRHVTQKLKHTKRCEIQNKKAALSQGNRTMPQLFF